MYYFLHLFCLDPDKYGGTPELVLGPLSWVGMTWGYFRGGAPGEDTGPPDDHLIRLDDTVMRLAGEEGSFYSDLAIYTSASPHRVDLPDGLGGLPLYPHPSRIGDCLACEHPLGVHDSWPAESTAADWHSSLPETPCDLCGCTWAEEPTR